jgi:hypothetical protein
MKCDTQHNDTQHNGSVVMLSVIYAECRGAKTSADFLASLDRAGYRNLSELI